MRVMLEIADGPQAGVRIPVATGEPLSVGRTAKSRLVLAHDSYLSGLHFSVEVEGSRCLLRDANSSNGTFVNEQRISEVELRDGDRILAGQTRFAIRLEQRNEIPTRATAVFSPPEELLRAMASAGAPLDPIRQDLVEHLRRVEAPLFGLVDAQATPALGLMISHSPAPSGPLAQGGPYLVFPQPDPALLPELARLAWGLGRMVFLTSRHPMDVVRTHLNAYFGARTADGRPFRFPVHNPRVLQHYLNGAAAEEAAQFFGPVETFYMEDPMDGRALLEFQISADGARKRMLRLGGAAHGAPVS